MIPCHRHFRLSEKELRLISIGMFGKEAMPSDDFSRNEAWNDNNGRQAEQKAETMRKPGAESINARTSREAVRDDTVDHIATRLEEKMGKRLDASRSRLESHQADIAALEKKNQGSRATNPDLLATQDTAIEAITAGVTAGGTAMVDMPKTPTRQSADTVVARDQEQADKKNKIATEGGPREANNGPTV